LPLRPDFRNLKRPDGTYIYRGPTWKAQRERLLERCDHKCERCRVPNHERVIRADQGSWQLTTARWYHPDHLPPRAWKRIRTAYIVLTMAHLTHDPLQCDDADLAMLCQYCHLHYDLLQHRETRCNRKDLARPLIALSDLVQEYAQAGAGI
jgi:hypothetical protein